MRGKPKLIYIPISRTDPFMGIPLVLLIVLKPMSKFMPMPRMPITLAKALLMAIRLWQIVPPSVEIQK
jgi:hypothetical protein